MLRSSFARTLFTVAAALFAVSTAGVADGDAQVVTAEVRGTVTDASGQPLAGASVTVTDLRTNLSRTVATNASGRYFVTQLQPGGPFSVTARTLGYRAVTQSGIQITLNQAEPVDFQLESAPVEVEGLTVTADQPNDLFSPGRTGQATRVSELEIETFPTIERNVLDLALLSPYANTFENAPSIAGKANRFNNIQIDGAVNNDVFGVGETGTPGGQANAKPITLEAIQEFNILVAPFDVRYSNFSGGLINAVTKSGTNDWTLSGFGLFTNESFVSELDGSEFGEFSDNQFGGTIGGPIVRDKAFFFAAGEFQRADQPFEGFEPGQSNDLTGELGIDPAEAVEIASIFRDSYGVEPGTTAALSTENPRTNLFGRLDVLLNDENRLVLRHNFASGDNDLSCNRGGFGEYCYTSNLAPFTSTTNSTVAELFSQLGETWENELLLTASFIREERDPAASFGQVTVEASADFLAGAERFSQANSLDQNIFQITNNLTGRFGDHRLTFGTSNEFYSFENLFEPGLLGLWTFDSIDDFAANSPSEYVRRVPVAGVPESELPADFSVAQLGFYVQDEWSVSDELTLTGGLRADIPIFPDDPRENSDFASSFGRSNAIVPTNVLWQPRVGFNYTKISDYRTQLRGGIGLFAGRSPYVWISNAYGNTGRQSVDLVCTGANAPAFSPGDAPSQCVDGSGATESGEPVINIVDEDFKFPVDLKASIGVDRELPGGFAGTVELLYSKAVEEVFFEEVNLGPVTGTDPVTGRPFFGTPTADGCGSRGGCFTNNRLDDDFAQVVNLTNRSESEALFLTVGLQRDFSDWLRVRGSYTYGDVEDLQVQQSSQATSNFGRNPISGDPNDPELADSNYEVENKVVLAATARFDFENDFFVEVTPTYFGQSGLPYSYVVRGDPNGDGYRNAVISRDNDLIYIPNGISELAFETPGDAAAYQALIESDDCLSSQRGSLMTRNSCRNPWNHSLDLQFVVGLPIAAGDVELVGIVKNLFEWELEQSRVDRGIEVLRIAGREGGADNGRFVYEYTGPEAGSDGEIEPFSTFSPESNRFIQLGLRFRY